MRTRSAWPIVVVLLLAAACGGGSSSPSSPTPVQGSSSAGAQINGTVQSGAGVAASTGAAAESLTVEVIGTSLSAAVGPLGQFTLANVPAGAVELRFRGPGVDARLSVGQLSNGEVVTIIVSVSGSNAVIRTDDRSGNGEVRVSGTVERLTGTATAFTFFVGSRQVRGAADTQFTGEGSSSRGFSNLRNGSAVEVRGALSGDILVASRVQLRGDDDDDDDLEDDEEDEDEFEGRLTAMTGTAPVLTLTVGGRTVVTSASTVVRRRGNEVGFGALQLQQVVEVEGTPRTGGGLNARKITIEDDDDDDEDNEVRVEGSIAGLSSLSSCPAVTFSVGGRSVATTASTRFDDVSCSGLSNGMRVEVRGQAQANGSIRATRVKRD